MAELSAERAGPRTLTLYPAIDIRGGRAVRLTRGDYAAETRYDADPLDAARRWQGGGAEILHVVDLDGARAGRPEHLDAIARIASELALPIQVGGGLRDADSVSAVLEAGVDRAMLGTRAQREPAFVGELVAEHGPERIVAAVDARGGRVAVEGWEQPTETGAAELVAELTDVGVRRFIYTPVEVDGTLSGPGLDGLAEVAAACEGGGAELIYSGGIGSLHDLRSLAALPIPSDRRRDRRPGAVRGEVHRRRGDRRARRGAELMGVLGLAARTGMRWTVWARVLILAEVALAIKRHLDLLDADEKDDLQRLVRKSKGRPSNLSRRERERLGRIVGKLEPSMLAREVSVAATPWRRKP